VAGKVVLAAPLDESGSPVVVDSVEPDAAPVLASLLVVV
jgi:hypothetical protein